MCAQGVAASSSQLTAHTDVLVYSCVFAVKRVQ